MKTSSASQQDGMRQRLAAGLHAAILIAAACAWTAHAWAGPEGTGAGVAPAAPMLQAAPAAEVAPPAPRIETHRITSPHFAASKLLLVYLPPDYNPQPAAPYPVIYFLHGLGNTPNDFLERGAAALTDQLIREGRVPPVVIALPTGAVSYYVNRKDGGAPYEDHVRLEVPAYVESHYAVRRDRGGRAMAGISMGGYGSLKIGLRYPEGFSSVSAHTPFLMEEVPTGEGTDRQSRMFMQVMRTLFGDPIDETMWNENNPFALAARLEGRPLPMFISSASQDRYGLNVPAEAFHQRLLELNVPHTFEAFEGLHGWTSLLDHWEAILKFHAAAFEPAPSPGS